MPLLLVIFLLLPLFGIDVELREDKNIQVDRNDISHLRELFLKKYNFHITDSRGAKRLVRENRILANRFLKEGLLSQERKSLQLEIEEILAKRYINHLQERIGIDERVIKSYYLDHIEEFRKSPKIHLIRYRFHDLDQAYHFYKESLHTPIEKLLKKYKPQKEDKGTKEISRLSPTLRSFIGEGKEKYVTPPFVVGKGVVDLFYIDKYFPSQGYREYQEVKEEIKQRLYKESFSQARQKALQESFQ